MSKSSKKKMNVKISGVEDLPAELRTKHTHVQLRPDTLHDTNTPIAHDVYAELGIDNSFSLARFQEEFEVKIRSMNKEEMVFDVIGLDAPMANALRRMMIAEVPTMAIETVYFSQNTSIMQDEVLAHRLGLVPIKVDPRLFTYFTKGGEFTDTDTLLFELDVKCTRNEGTLNTDAEDVKYSNSVVLSGDLKWKGQGDGQSARMASLVHDDIILTQLRPGQAVVASCFCHKGVGRDHAKFSPVATASYRLLPDIEFKKPITGASAEKLVKTCPMKVFDIEDIGGTKTARVARADNCSICRECIRHDEWAPSIKLQRKKRHYIFSIESTGALLPQDIFTEAIKEFLAKISRLREAVNV
eukprot:TRINITY_DN5744_c0_g1_i1.p1 TRINITY_DN5744_c0_g1~~TRINITY_DN5744_c0_g1_i1.p1  ORF type:complete len:356 (-),score=76.88 TRINITY_DN5744_c0_g1_i1:55-1122(-)